MDNIKIDNLKMDNLKIANIKVLETDINETGIIYKHDVVYTVRDGIELHLQIIMPYRFTGDNKYPLMVFVQGSAWFKQDCYANIPVLSRFAHRGYAVAIVEYRHNGIAAFPAQVQDAKTAVRFMKVNADKYNVNPDEVYIWGDSSGGHTALLAGLTAGEDIFDTGDYIESDCNVKGIIDFYGVTDITEKNDFPTTPNHLQADSPAGLFIGGKNVLENMDIACQSVCMNHISNDKEIPPVLIIHGTKDTIVSFHQSIVLYEKLIECNKKADFYAVEGADHGGLPFWTDKIFDIIEAFINT